MPNWLGAMSLAPLARRTSSRSRRQAEKHFALIARMQADEAIVAWGWNKRAGSGIGEQNQVSTNS
jgi:hypothetical protein